MELLCQTFLTRPKHKVDDSKNITNERTELVVLKLKYNRIVIVNGDKNITVNKKNNKDNLRRLLSWPKVRRYRLENINISLSKSMLINRVSPTS